MHVARAVFAAVVLAASPALFAAPCAGFNDVSDSDPFCVYVEWIKNRGITLGTTATTYTPDSAVTRMQMAAFMYRLGFQNAFLQGGNAFGATAVLGTTDNQPLDVRVNGQRVMRYQPTADAPNVIGGHPANSSAPDVRGATIGGGGGSDLANTVQGNFGTVSGGVLNAAGALATVAGGTSNVGAPFSAIGGGAANIATASYAAIPGGRFNTATGFGAVVAGGSDNLASGDLSWAGGSQAITQSPEGTVHHGAFVWSDLSFPSFHSSADNEFAARATGGVRFVTAVDPLGNPTRTVRINPNAELEFGNQTRQMLNLWGSGYSIGVQSGTLYQRTSEHVAWYAGGTHNDATFNAGGGSLLMSLSTNGTILSAPVGTARALTFVSVSDRLSKADFEAVDVNDTLAKVIALPIERWSYRSQPGVRHIGPVAQDFHTAFGVGSDDRSLATVDVDGVALAAIQGLNAKLDAERATKDAEIAALRAELAELRTLRAEMAVMLRLLAERPELRATQTAEIGR